MFMTGYTGENNTTIQIISTFLGANFDHLYTLSFFICHTKNPDIEGENHKGREEEREGGRVEQRKKNVALILLGPFCYALCISLP